MAQSSVQLVIWDLDGTLVNSLPLTFAAFNAGLKPFLGRELSDEEIMSHFGPPDQEILRRLVGDANADECNRLMVAHMSSHLNAIQPFPAVVDAIADLKENGIRHAIFTGRGRRTTDLILRNLEFEIHFDAIVTNDDVEHFKPHPEGIFKICQNLDVSPSRAIMVGDTPSDIKAARAAGTQSAVSCLWDPRAKEHKLREAGPDHIIRDPLELTPWLMARR